MDQARPVKDIFREVNYDPYPSCINYYSVFDDKCEEWKHWLCKKD